MIFVYCNIFILFQYLHWQIWLENMSIETISLCLSCVDATLSNTNLSNILGLQDKTSYICSMVASLHATISNLIKPKALPR